MRKQQVRSRHDGFHTLTKLPPPVSKLFQQGPPLPPSKIRNTKIRRSNSYFISDVNSLLEELVKYKHEAPEGSKLEYLEAYKEAVNECQKVNDELIEKARHWNPEADPKIRGDPYKTLFVGRLSYEADEVELQRQFLKFGEVESSRVVRDLDGKSRGYGFIQFANYDDAKRCFKEVGVRKGINIMGRTAIVDIERGRTVKYFKPRRLGGGLGGRGYTKRNIMTKPDQPKPQYELKKPVRRHDTYEKPSQNMPISSYQRQPMSNYRSRRDRSRDERTGSGRESLMY